MLSVKGIYENGKVQLIEPIPFKKRTKVIVTILEEANETEFADKDLDINAFDDMVGVITEREDGSLKHDQYLNSQDC